MSTFEYNHDGRRFTADSALRKDSVFVTAQPTNVPLYGIWIPNADVPTVAAELLKAAGQESAIVPKSKKEIEDFGHGNLRCGLTDVGFTSSSEWARDRAAELLALAEYRDAKAAREAAEKAEAEAAEKKLQERRDALATELFGLDLKFDELGPRSGGRTAIHRIITLQDKLAAK